MNHAREVRIVIPMKPKNKIKLSTNFVEPRNEIWREGTAKSFRRNIKFVEKRGLSPSCCLTTFWKNCIKNTIYRDVTKVKYSCQIYQIMSSLLLRVSEANEVPIKESYMGHPDDIKKSSKTCQKIGQNWNRFLWPFYDNLKHLKRWTSPTRPGSTVPLFNGLFLGKYIRWRSEILTRSPFKSSTCDFKLWNWYLWRFGTMRFSAK